MLRSCKTKPPGGNHLDGMGNQHRPRRPRMSPDPESVLLRILDEAVVRSPAASALNRLADDVEHRLEQDAALRLAWEVVPLGTYGPLPRVIRSSWVFVLRAGCSTGAERHPNSVQRVMALRDDGDFQTWSKGGWESNRLRAGSQLPLEARWLSIPRNVWHRPVVSDRNWAVVSFHTVPAASLIEELAADDSDPDARLGRSETYAGRSAR